jgi:hypothetical protein
VRPAFVTPVLLIATNLGGYAAASKLWRAADGAGDRLGDILWAVHPSAPFSVLACSQYSLRHTVASAAQADACLIDTRDNCADRGECLAVIADAQSVDLHV